MSMHTMQDVRIKQQLSLFIVYVKSSGKDRK